MATMATGHWPLARDVEDIDSARPSTAKAPRPLPAQGEAPEPLPAQGGDQHLSKGDQQVHGVAHQEIGFYFTRLPNIVEGSDYDSKAWVNKIPESQEDTKKMTDDKLPNIARRLIENVF